MNPVAKKSEPVAAHDIIMSVVMELAAVEASATDSDEAEFEKRQYAHQLRDELLMWLASLAAPDMPKRSYQWVN